MADMIRFSIIFLCSLAVLSICLAGGNTMAEEKTHIGVVEEVILLPWGVRMPARIDSGAATSSLDARDLTIKENTAEFKLPDRYGGIHLSLPIVDWRVVRSAQGKKRRPVVEIELCISTKRLRTQVNLMDRSGVKYPIIIGRNVLRENFVIDCTRSECAPPACPGIP